MDWFFWLLIRSVDLHCYLCRPGIIWAAEVVDEMSGKGSCKWRVECNKCKVCCALETAAEEEKLSSGCCCCCGNGTEQNRIEHHHPPQILNISISLSSSPWGNPICRTIGIYWNVKWTTHIHTAIMEVEDDSHANRWVWFGFLWWISVLIFQYLLLINYWKGYLNTI